jgi:hypothetical protein
MTELGERGIDGQPVEVDNGRAFLTVTGLDMLCWP